MILWLNAIRGSQRMAWGLVCKRWFSVGSTSRAGKPWSLERRVTQSKLMLEKHQNPEYRAVFSKAMRDPDRRAQHSKLMRERHQTPEFRAAYLKKMRDPDMRAQNSKVMREKYQNPEFHAAHLKRAQDPEYRAAQSEKTVEWFKDPQNRANLSKKVHEKHQDPDFRAAFLQLSILQSKKKINQGLCGELSVQQPDHRVALHRGQNERYQGAIKSDLADNPGMVVYECRHCDHLSRTESTRREHERKLCLKNPVSKRFQSDGKTLVDIFKTLPLRGRNNQRMRKW